MKRTAWITAIAAATIAIGCTNMTTQQQGTMSGAAIGAAAGAMVGGAIAVLGAWLLFKTQLDLLDGMVRTLTDILWTGSRRVRAWRGGDVRAVYYCVMAVVVLWAIVALRLAQPIVLLLIAANVAGSL